MISRRLSDEIRQHAIDSYPLESCGLVVDGTVNGRDIDGTYLRVQNVHETPEKAFRISSADILQWTDRLTAVVHSHPDGYSAPSSGDMLSQAAMNIPFIIVATNGTNCEEPFEFGDCLERYPYEGRPFRHAVTDCYELVRDYYWNEFGIFLPNMARDWGWWKDGLDLYRDYMEPAGFRVLAEGEIPQKHDGFIVCIGSQVPNHGGVYLGNGKILHHLGSTRHGPYSRNHLSVIEYGLRYQSLSPMYLRYKDPLP